MNGNTLDLFKDWTPEMIACRSPGKSLTVEHRMNISRSLMGIVRGSPSEEHRRKNSEAQMGRPGTYGMLGRTHSKETKKKMSISQTGHPTSEETKEKISNTLMGRPASKESRRKNSESNMGSLNHFWGKHHSEETRRGISESLMGRVQSEETKGLRSESMKKYWDGLSEEALNRRVKVVMEACHQRPTMPEGIVDRYLKKNFPGEYGYNGDFSLGITIGGRIPDFPNINGKKEVISVMGGFGHFHFLEDEKNEIDHYAKYGYKCIVVWEWDCYIPGELDKIFKGVLNG